MATAIRLKLLGYNVDVFEKNDYPGGKLSHFETNGFRFDAGPSLFTSPHLIEELFTLANEPIASYFTYEKLSVACNYFYDDGVCIKAYTNKDAFAKELQQKTNEPTKNLYQYLYNSSTAYNQIAVIFLRHSLHTIQTLFKAPIIKAISKLKLAYLFKSLNDYNETAFRSPKLVQLFNRFATYNGSNPYKAPAMLSLIAHLEHNEGAFYPKGGMISITNALYRLALKLGVQFSFGKSVQNILTQNNCVTGVMVDNDQQNAAIVVSNMDVYFTYKNLLNDSTSAAKVKKQERSSSALIFYWGMNKTFPMLDLHNIFFSGDYKAEFDAIFNTGLPFNDPTVYINITNKLEPGEHAPLGKENWFVMVNVPANNGQDWTSLEQFYRQVIIQKLNKIIGENIASFIAVSEVLTPVTIESKTASYMGSLYGTSSNSRMAAFMRHPNYSKTTGGLYFVGGSVHPGGGIPLCLSSAAIVSNLIIDKYKHNI
ncbi:MAG: phytoene desaturase [Chitinophagaceae bacterium]|nr:phytoene desaturase [Chitinophagaceae bacterium]